MSKMFGPDISDIQKELDKTAPSGWKIIVFRSHISPNTQLGIILTHTKDGTYGTSIFSASKRIDEYVPVENVSPELSMLVYMDHEPLPMRHRTHDELVTIFNTWLKDKYDNYG